MGASKTPKYSLAGTTGKCDDCAAIFFARWSLPRMDYVRFGRTGLKVSQLCLGTMSMGSSAWKGWVLDEEDSIPILRRALDLGITFFDMADWYSTGRNEEVVGQNLLRMSAGAHLVLATN